MNIIKIIHLLQQLGDHDPTISNIEMLTELEGSTSKVLI